MSKTSAKPSSLFSIIGAVSLLSSGFSPLWAQTETEQGPSNLSRLLAGSRIQVVDATTGLTISPPGLVSTIDDDVASGWTPPVGKTVVLLTLPQEADISGFTLFAPGAAGSYKVEVLDQPGAESGRQLFSNDITNPKSSTQTPAVGRYLRIELDLTATAPIRSIDTIGKPKPGTDNMVSVISPVSGEQNSGSDGEGQLVEVNFAADALGAKVAEGANEGLSAMIDGDSATSGTIVINASNEERPLIELAAAVEVSRVSLSFAEAEGQVTFIATDSENPNGRVLGQATLDGTGKTLTLDVGGISAQNISIKWEPSNGSSLVVGEVGVFAMARVRRERVNDDTNSRFVVLPANSPASAPAAPSAPVAPVAPVTPPPRPEIQPPIILPPPEPVSA